VINKERLIRLTRDLLRINSENPPGNEKAIASCVASCLGKIGLKARIRAFYKDRDNVSAVWAGKRRDGALLITPHLDTVPAGSGWTQGPFSGNIRRGRIYGRGATDCKGNLAVALEVLTSLTQDGFRPEHDVIFLATADEEAGSSKGLIPFLEKNIIKPDFALILDSDDCNIIVAQKGLIHFMVKVSGRKAHGAYPHRGVNAIDHACRLMEILKNLRFGFKRHSLLQPPTVNIGTIRGGDKVNMVADWCVFEADLRFSPGMDSKKILGQIKRGFDRARVDYEIVVSDIQQPYEISTRHPLVSSLKKAARGIVKDSPVKGSEGATVITFFKKKNIPAVATGYGASGCAHATDEYARVDDLYRGALVLERFIRIFDKREAGAYFKSS
jgi:acetylornithine deacetylase/succinyl-diaminopimelate desuccinylase family protein